jgi:hypothetical protein
MALACFINPWGWRLALLPLQTLRYMKKYAIGGATGGGKPHPWDNILELQPTITEHWPACLSDYAVLIMLTIAGAAAALQLAAWLSQPRRHEPAAAGEAATRDPAFKANWAHLFMMAGMLFVGLQVRRNIGVASLIVVPSALKCVTDSCRVLLAPRLPRAGFRLLAAANAAVMVLAAYGGYQIISGRLFEADRQPTRFAFGLSNTMLPLGASSWLDEYAPKARIWCDFSTSSTLHFFTHPHKEVPILTNTWAYPPEIMAANQFFRKALIPFGKVADRYNIDAVVLRSDWSIPLNRQLGADPEWKMVHVEGAHVLYLRAEGKYGELAASHEIGADNFAADPFVVKELGKDPSLKRSVLAVANTFRDAGEPDLAIEVIEAGLKYRAPDLPVLEALLNLYVTRGDRRRNTVDKRFIDDSKRMNYVIESILELEPEYFSVRRQ